MIVFADRHHDALYASLQLLFEKRLGWTLYHPYGMDWFDSGNWKIGDPYGETARNTALQYLASGDPGDGTPILYPHTGISFEEFKTMKIDVIVASYYPHIDVYTHLRDLYHPNAKVVCQYGNEWPIHPLCKNLMASTAPMSVSSSINSVFYHQEFDTSLYAPRDYDRHFMCSYVNALPLNGLFHKDWEDFQTMQTLLPEYKVSSFGGGCPQGCLNQHDLALSMNDCTFAIHFKEGGDGYGHVIHQLAATATPIIFKGHQYTGKLAEVFLEDEKTGFDADQHSILELCRRVKQASKEEARVMGREIYRRFQEQVNFDQEEQKIRAFLANLQ